MRYRILTALLIISFVQAQTIKTFHPNGKIQSATFYKKGKKNGVEHIYYLDGATLKYAKNYQNDKLHGLQQIYRKDALLVLEESYKSGKLHGKSRYYTGGLLTKEIDYKEGEIDGKYIEFYPSGVKKLEIIFKQNRVIEGHLYSEIGQGKAIDNQKLQTLNLQAFIGSLLHVEP